MPSHVIAQPETLYVGTPAYLIASENPDGTTNLAPASSYWALGNMLVLGLETDGQTVTNLLERGDMTVNFPSGELWRAVIALDGTTGRNPVPDGKPRFRHEPDKFGAAGLTPQDSEKVAVPRVAECRLQFEAILKPGTALPDPTRWSPLVYRFRHFFAAHDELGWLAKSPTADGPPPTR